MDHVYDFTEHRIQLWNRLKAEHDRELSMKPRENITVTLSDGTITTATSWETSPFDILKSLRKPTKGIIISKADDTLWDLLRPLEKDCNLSFFDWDSTEAKNVFWHSTAHVLGQVVEVKYNGHLCVGPSLKEGGFFYDVFLPNSKIFSEHDYGDLKSLFKKFTDEKQRFERLQITKEFALEMFKYNKYKLEIIAEKVPDGSLTTVYKCGSLIDLCRGPHIPNTGYIKALEITMNSASFWKGDSKNDSLQRIYGISFPEVNMMKTWIENRKKALENDHRLVGKHQELFLFQEFSPGSCFMLPNGTRIINTMIDFVRTEYRKRGFQEVITPNIFNVDLWNISGHWENYKNNMFSFKVEEKDWALKPMNCPGHCLIFASKQRSYRDLPMRLADFGVLHRNEFSGALTGLTRVRKFHQDDAHIFCSPSQIQQEIRSAIEFLDHVYKTFDFKYAVELSTMPENHLGSVETWQHAESALEQELNHRFGKDWVINKGDGAFYGPKIDVKVLDVLGRTHQCATIQLDFQLPIRFNLEFIEPDGSSGRPVIIHRAIFGSVERFLAILIEHTGGRWPFWLSPFQSIVVPITESNFSYARKVRDAIFAENFESVVDDSDHLFAKKIRDAQVAQYNFIIVVGTKEELKNTVNIRTRDNKIHGEQTVEQLIETFKRLVQDKSI